MTEPFDRKIIDPPTLLGVARSERAAGRTIVHCHGCFDIVHPGHIRYLRFARQLGDVLVVSLTGDDAVEKGPDRPYIPQELRAENLAALEFVDWVVINPHATAAELLESLRPDVYCKGREYAQTADRRFLREREIVEQYGGRIVFHSGDVVFSSSRLIRSLEHDEDLDECRWRALCSRSGIDVESVRATLEQFAGVRAIVVGDLIQERYVSCDAREAADDAPVLSLQQLGITSHWGGAAAVALQLRALGASPVVVTASTEPDAGKETGIDLFGQGIDGLEVHTLPVRREVVERTTFVADDVKLFRVIAGACHPLDSSWERRAETLIRDLLGQAELLVWCDHGYGMVTPGLVAGVTRAARQAGVTIAGCAPGPRGDISVLSETDLLCVTERRLRESLHDMGSGLPSVTWNLLNRTRGSRAIVALHKRGLIGFDGRGEEPAGAHHPHEGHDAAPNRLRSEFVPAVATHYVDLLGVEEAILSAASLTLAKRGSLAMATYIATGAAALAAARPGRTPVAIEDLFAWVDTRPELRPQNCFLPDAATVGDIARLAPPLATTAAAESPTGSDRP